LKGLSENRDIFNTDNPFRSVGIAQVDLLDSIIVRKLAQGVQHDSIKYLIELIINNETDQETLHSELTMVLLKNLKTPDVKELAIEQCQALKAELTKPQSTKTKKARREYSDDFELCEKINILVEMVFRLYMALGEYSEAITYYHNNYQEKNPEVNLYVLLKLLSMYNLTADWRSEYEKAVQKGIQPRPRLQKMYEYIRDKGQLPERLF
jgi:hypothetical protein